MICNRLVKNSNNNETNKQKSSAFGHISRCTDNWNVAQPEIRASKFVEEK